MSADNGIVIWERLSGVYEVREYSASIDCEGGYGGPLDMHLLGEYPTLQEALEYASNQYTEYGVSVVEEK